jgi:hypothetical protein
VNAQLIADLRETKTQLETRGRCTRGAVNDLGEICLAVAVGNATRGVCGVPRSLAVFRVLRIALTGDSGVGDIIAFNEHPNTTDEDVYNLIDKALADAGGL